MTYIKLHIASFLIFLLVTACNENKTQTLTVSIEPQRFLLEQIVGNKWDINTILAKGADPENFDPSMSTMKKALDSKAFFQMGNMPFEEILISRITQNYPNFKIINTSQGINIIHGTHGYNHEHATSHNHDADPHVWSSVKNAKIIAQNMYNGIIEIDSENTEFYHQNYLRLNNFLDSLDQVITTELAPHAGKSFIVWHPSLSYFAKDYSLEQIALGHDNKEMSITELKHNIDNAITHNVSIMFIQPEFDQKRSQEIATQIKTSTITINPLAYDWDKEMLHIAKAIANN